MDYFKAVISNSGDETLYQALSGEVERRLPTAPVNWKRSYGRPSKEVVLQANFIRFDSSQFPRRMDSVSNLTSQPLLHIFWTSCLDNDKYKSGVKNHIMRWQKVLLENHNADWLIVHVMYQDNTKTNKSKINLPRSTVYDKIRTEFGQKFSDRCIQLWEPDKETLFTKSGESWDALLMQLRNLLLESFGRHLDSFEDRIRVMREKYADPQWPFLDYFVIHEELALIYQSITLREDALVQYDEVDALLSQFIINCSGRALPNWLQKFSVTPSNWDGVSLSNQNMESYKTLIKSGYASLIDFRNYLFSRQCKLLINMNRKQSIPSRMMEFIYMLVQELKLLNIDVQYGSVACWTVLTCMQLFQILETVEEMDYEYKSTYAHMYNYMRQKFHYLGHITGLYYNREQTDEEKKISELVIAGFGKYPSRKKEMPSSIKLLTAALTSKDAYETLYLEFSNKTIKLMTELRRTHFSMWVGIDVAKFHLQYGRYDTAEILLDKAWSIYKQQKWESLYTDVLIPLADCQLKHNLKTRYINSISLLSCAKCLPLDTRNYYSNELLKLSNDYSIESPVIGIDPVLKIVDIHIDLVKNKGHIGDMINVTVDLKNELTIDLQCKSIFIVLKHSDLSNPKSFNDDSPASHSSFTYEASNLDVYVSLLNEEKPKEVSKEPLTPSNILKKIKGHRRTWSKNRNVLENKSNNDSQNSSPSDSRSSSISHTLPDNNTARKALFTDDGDGKGLPNGELHFCNDHFKRASSLHDIDFKSSSGSGDLRSSCIDLRSSYSDIKSNSLDGNVTSDIECKSSVETAVELKTSNNVDQSVNTEIKPIDNMIQTSNNMIQTSNETSVLHNGQEVNEPDGVVNPGKPLATSSVSHPTGNTSVSTKGDIADDSLPNKVNSNATVGSSSSGTTSINSSDDIFLEPELEENLDQMLVSSENFLLTPGHNSIQLKSRINIEGKFILQSMSCIVGNLKFYKLLTQLPRETKSFFMVADPPKIVWTSDHLVDYLLTGCKQRLHVTLLNGPGVILHGSVVHISSNSGVTFQDLPNTPIQIYPLERDGIPRDEIISGIVESDSECRSLLLYLPECKPYERVNLCFDVVGTINCHENDDNFRNGDNSMVQHKLQFHCLWLKGLVDSMVRLDCLFYTPFEMNYESVQKGSLVFVKVILHGVNPICLSFFTPKLSSTCEELSFHLLSQNEVTLHGMEESLILWTLDCSQLTGTSTRQRLSCKFEVNFKDEESDHSDIGYYCKPINITYTKCLYNVQVTMPTACLNKSQPCSVTVTINKLFLENFSYRLFIILNTEKQTWDYFTSKKYDEVTFNDGSQETSLVIDIQCLQEGSIAAPVFLLAKLTDIEMKDSDVILDTITSFEYGQVDYKHAGQIIFYNEEDIVSTL